MQTHIIGQRIDQGLDFKGSCVNAATTAAKEPCLVIGQEILVAPRLSQETAPDGYGFLPKTNLIAQLPKALGAY